MIRFMVVLLLIVCCYKSGAVSCRGEEEVACAAGDQCIPHRKICDGNRNCGDGSDEDPDLCQAWQNDDCDNGKVFCFKDGYSQCLPIFYYCLPGDPPCSDYLDHRVCQMLEGKVLRSLSEFLSGPPSMRKTRWEKSEESRQRFLDNLDSTIKSDDCPRMFTRLANQCVSIFTVGSMTWGESLAFCRHLGGDLMVFSNVSHYTKVLRHLQNLNGSSDFWIGGRFVEEALAWIWVDEKPMQMGSPFWVVKRGEGCSSRSESSPPLSRGRVRVSRDQGCYLYRQAPLPDTDEPCASISHDHFYYINDADCNLKKSPLCVHG